MNKNIKKVNESQNLTSFQKPRKNIKRNQSQLDISLINFESDQ